MKYHGKTEKTFLKQLSLAVAVLILGYILWAITNYFFFRPDTDLITLENFSFYKEGQIQHKKKERLFIIRDSLGLYAVSDACTHRGCMVLLKDKMFECPCHSAAYTLDGQVINGPAEKPLDHYYIYKNKQSVLVVDVTKTINSDIRYSE